MTAPEQRPWLTTWGEVIPAIRSLTSDDLICFDGGPTAPEDPCLVADSLELDEDEDVPPEAAERGWTTVLGRDTVLGVLRNLSQQTDAPDLPLVLRAIAYYVDHDAYLTVS